MQYVIGPLPFKSTVQAAAARCGICNFYPAENVIRAWENGTMDQRNICPKCAQMGHDALKAIIFPKKCATEACSFHDPEMSNGCNGLDWRGRPGPAFCREYKTAEAI